jgi:predicted XRE-type DNA-binding protein
MTLKFNQIFVEAPNTESRLATQHLLPLSEMNLPALRKSRQKSQAEIASVLDVKQAEVSKMERRPDMYISTLLNFVQALGGRIEIIARFPDAAPVRISQFASNISGDSSWSEISLQVEHSVLGDPNRGISSNSLNEAWSFSPPQLKSDTAFGARLVTGKDWFSEMLFHPE